MKKRFGTFVLGTLTAVALFAMSALATDGIWTQPGAGTYTWSDGANWLGNNVANGTDANALFNVTPGGDQTVNLDTAVTLGGLSLEWTDRRLTIAGPETLTLDVTSGTPIINVDSGRRVTINTVLAGSDGLQLEGGGRLNLGGLSGFNNTLTGGVTVIGGIVEATEVRANSIGDGPISLSEGGQLILRGSNTSSSQVFVGTGGGLMQNRGNNHYQTTGILTGTGTLIYGNAGGSGGRSLRFLSTDNDFTGGFDFRNSLQTIRVNSLGGGNNIIFNASGTFLYDTGAVAALTLGAIELSGSSGTINNANSDHAVTINSDLIATDGGAKTLTLTGAAGPTNMFAGAIADETDGGAGTVALTKSGASTWVLSGANTYSGPTTIEAGTLSLGSSGAIASSTITVGSAGTLDVSEHGGWTLGASQTLQGNGTGNGAVTVNGVLSPGTSVGTLTFDSGLTLGNGSEIRFEFLDNSEAGTTYDQIVGLSLSLPTGETDSITLRVVGLQDHTVALNDSFTVFTGTVNNFDASKIDIVNESDWANGWEVSTGESLVLTAIPEPGTAGLLAIFAGAAILRRRLRK